MKACRFSENVKMRCLWQRGSFTYNKGDNRRKEGILNAR